MKLRKKALFSLSLTLSLLLTLSHTIYADAWSDYKTKTVKGYTYKFCAFTGNRYFSSGNTIEASTLLKCPDSNVPKGYMGAQARLYTEDEDLVTASDWVFNSSPLSAYIVDSETTTTEGNYYSHGRVKLYNGDGHDMYETYKSPMGVLKASRSASNTSNETDIVADTTGELEYIKALGVDGTKGYVLSADLNAKSYLSEDADLQNTAIVKRRIPLYDNNGQVIGEFELQTSISCE